MSKIKQENMELKEHISYLEAQLKKKELEYKPAFKCVLKIINEETSIEKTIPTNHYVVDGDTVEFTFWVKKEIENE